MQWEDLQLGRRVCVPELVVSGVCVRARAASASRCVRRPGVVYLQGQT